MRPSLALKIAAVILAAQGLAGCNTLQRLSEVGRAPSVSRITDPTQEPGYEQVSMPMPAPTAPNSGTNSLWRAGSRSFFKDQRASEIGDILTVSVNINESGALSNKTSTARSGTQGANSDFTLLGVEGKVGSVFSGADPANLFSFGSTSGTSGTGAAARSEVVVVNLAAQVTQKMPNGNLVIAGRQELRVNGELRELSVQGIIRPEDISSLNTIGSEKIAEARIIYGGRGTLSDVQQPRWGHEVFDILAPF